MKPLSLLDLAFVLFESSDTPMHVCGLTLLQSPDNSPDFGRELYSRLIEDPNVSAPFNRKLCWQLTGRPYWQKWDNVDLEEHVHLAMLPKPGSDEQLIELVSRFHSHLLDRNRPLWEALVIDGLSGGRVAVVIKVHHSLADGVKVSKMFDTSTSVSPTEGSTPYWQCQLSKHRDQPTHNFIESIFGSAKQVGRQLSMMRGMLRLGRKMTFNALHLGDSQLKLPFTAPKTPLNQRHCKTRNIDLARLPLESFKRIGKLTGASLNDVVLAVCDMALHRYLSERDDLPDKPLVVLMPVNLRSEDDLDGSNKLSFGLVELGGKVATPIERLAAVQNSTQGIKAEAVSLSAPAYTNYSILVNGLALLGGKLNINYAVPPAHNLLISNVPGPKEERYFFGAKVLQVYPISLLIPGQTFNITLYSYAGYLHFGMVSCKKSLPGLDVMPEYLSQALEQLDTGVTMMAANVVKERLDSLGNQTMDEIWQMMTSELPED